MNELNELRAKASRIIAAYNPGGDFDKVVADLAAVGYAIEAALKTV